MIKVKHLNKAFGSIPVLRNLNLTVNGPLVLMGPSGCGKTTLLRILMGLETPDSGTVQGVGNIGAVFQESRLCPQLTAVGNICLVGGVNPAQAQAELQTLGFTQAELALPVARLSGGQQARTALARTLSHAKPLIVLDDPFAALDRNTEEEIFRELKAMSKDRIILLISHRLYLFDQTDQVIWMENGQTQTGTHEKMLQIVPEYANLCKVWKEGADHA